MCYYLEEKRTSLEDTLPADAALGAKAESLVASSVVEMKSRSDIGFTDRTQSDRREMRNDWCDQGRCAAHRRHGCL